MAAPLNPNQLKMFMRPDEVMDAVDGSYDFGTVRKLRNKVDTKLRYEASAPGSADGYVGYDDQETGPSLYESVRDGGVRDPIILQQRDDGGVSMGNGHHRLAAAKMAEEKTGTDKYLPVLHDADPMGRNLYRNFPGAPFT